VGDFSERDEEAAVLLAGWAAIAIDNAMMYEFSEARRKESERIARGLEMTRDVAVAIGTDVDLDRILELIAKRGRALVESTSMLIWLRDGKELVVRGERRRRRREHGRDTSPGGRERRLPSYPRPETLRIGRSSQRRPGRPAMLGEAGEHASLVVPMISRGVVVGAVLAVGAARSGSDFTEDE